MADEQIYALPGAGEETTASLRDVISSAVAKQRDGGEAGAAGADPAAAGETDQQREPKPAGDESRDERGRFTAKGDQAKPDAAAAASQGKDAAQQEAPRADGAKTDAEPSAKPAAPPTSWSPTAKAAYGDLPQPVKEAIAKREDEVNQGFAKFQEYKPLDQYIQMAKQSGTTLDKALQEYTGIEQALRTDLVAGITHLAQRQNVHPVQLAHAILARHGMAPPRSGEPGQQQLTHQQVPAVDLTPINQRIAAVERQFVSQQQASIDAEIETFASDPKHPYFHNVRETMGHLMNSGQAANMSDAYDKACWANPEIRALLIKQQAPAPTPKADDAVQRARAAAKATGGAPAAGYTPSNGNLPAGATVRDHVVAAVAAQRGI